MKINIYYGGRGIIGDPSLFAVKKMMQVFEELNVTVEKYDLYDLKNQITTLHQTLKDVDGIILASTVEWHGVGGYIMNFLDACWLYGDKEKITKIYMAPVVMATTYGEREAVLDLKNAWESLGGLTCDGVCGYISDISELENNKKYVELIEKSAENIYKSINQKNTALPASSRVVTQKVTTTKVSLFTQQENEQLSELVSDDSYVDQQKKDIHELADLFKSKLDLHKKDNLEDYADLFMKCFKPIAGEHMKYKVTLSDKNINLAIDIDNANCNVKVGDLAYPDVTYNMESKILDEIIAGRKTFNGGFMEGVITSKGDFAKMRKIDDFFPFMK